jgi:hypothetical protein
MFVIYINYIIQCYLLPDLYIWDTIGTNNP